MAATQISAFAVRTAPLNPANAHSHPIFPHSMLIRLITRTLLLSFHMNSQCQIPRLVRDLGIRRLPRPDHDGKLPATSRSSTLFTLYQKQSAKEQRLTPFLSAQASRSLLTLFTLAEISPAFATLTKNMPGIPSRSPQKQHYTASRIPAASVAAVSPRCHTFLSTAARIFFRHASVLLGC